MGKRIFLFLATNLAIVVTLSIVLSILGVGRYTGPRGLDIAGPNVLYLRRERAIGLVGRAERLQRQRLEVDSRELVVHRRIGLVAAGPYTPLILGPGDPGMAHQVDESVSIDALIRCADAYEAIGRELLG